MSRKQPKPAVKPDEFGDAIGLNQADYPKFENAAQYIIAVIFLAWALLSVVNSILLLIGGV